MIFQPAPAAAQEDYDPNILRINTTNATRSEDDRGRQSAIQYTVAPVQGSCEQGAVEPRPYTITLQGEARLLNPTGLSETFSDFDLRCNYQLTFGVVEGHCDPMAKIRVQHWGQPDHHRLCARTGHHRFRTSHPKTPDAIPGHPLV